MEDLVLSCLESRVEENRNLYARFLVGPFLKGDALTVATALRRVLLSSIESIGITALYIQGITHEFSTIVGVRESVLELSLNFQGIVLSYDKTVFQKKSFFDDLQIGYLQVQGPKVIYANHLKLPLGVKLVDPTQYIATVSKEGSIVLKFIIGKKRAFLHQNTGPESFFGNLARDLPIIGKISKKNIGRAKKTCFYKKGSTIDLLPTKLLSKKVLQRQSAIFCPCVVKKSRRCFTNARFLYQFTILPKVKGYFGPLLGHKQSLEKKRLSLDFTGSLYKAKNINKTPYINSKLIKAKLASKQSFITSPLLSRSENKKLSFYKNSGKLFLCKKKALFNMRFLTQQSKLFTNTPFSYKFYYVPLSPSYKSFYKANASVACKRTNLLTKVRMPRTGHELVSPYGTPTCTKVKGPRKKICTWTCISPLLKKNKPLLCKKNAVRKENDRKKKKVLFFKSKNHVFKSNICLRNVIPLDFTSTPILKVNFVVEIDDDVLYLRQKVRERIILEVWTNGSIHPRQAVHDAALSLTDVFSSFRSVYAAES